MTFMTTNDQASILALSEQVRLQNIEIAALRAYRKRARRAYRQLQACYEYIHSRWLIDRLANVTADEPEWGE